MTTNDNKKVICVKDIPSNIIEEAIFILKSDVSKVKNKKNIEIKNDLANKEAEYILKDYILKFSKANDEKASRSNFKKLKLKAILIASGLVIVCYILSLII